MMKWTHCASALALSLALSAAAWAGAESQKPCDAAKELLEPKEFVDATVQKVLAILRAPEYSDETQRGELREKIRTTLLEVVDMETIGALTLASHRGKFSDKQFQDFLDVFSKLLFTTYIAHLEKYSGETIAYLEAREMKTRDASVRRVEVETVVQSGDQKVPVIYRLMTKDKDWKLYDVHVEGVSLVLNFRKQFNEILRSKPAEALQERLVEKVRENEKQM